MLLLSLGAQSLQNNKSQIRENNFCMQFCLFHTISYLIEIAIDNGSVNVNIL